MFERKEIKMPKDWLDPVEHPEGSLDEAIDLAKKRLAQSRRNKILRSGAVMFLEVVGETIKPIKPITTKIISSMTEQEEKTGTLAWIKKRVKEASTWEGISLILGAAGIYLNPDLGLQIGVAVVAIIGVIEFIRDERNKDEEK